MLKHIIAASVESAFAGSVAFAVVTFPRYGWQSGLLTVFIFPVALILSILLAYPLIRLWQRRWLSARSYLFALVVLGFLLGAATPAAMFGSAGTMISLESLPFLSLYGYIGAICAAGGWNYVRRKVAL
ncbi:hypothetical protein [Microbulbifer halophilus]|uniref:Uncharacterized protein n=1 Tax=Microbulbifer halophilus TaxID=453963 RepID=A0ABW5EIR9_9GAMM|nr:hypothetical protein [Microbulbifer halophilus]MCW8128678.1 hypothetical protein [Microbulbifer halophilus]